MLIFKNINQNSNESGRDQELKNEYAATIMPETYLIVRLIISGGMCQALREENIKELKEQVSCSGGQYAHEIRQNARYALRRCSSCTKRSRAMGPLICLFRVDAMLQQTLAGPTSF